MAGCNSIPACTIVDPSKECCRDSEGKVKCPSPPDAGVPPLDDMSVPPDLSSGDMDMSVQPDLPPDFSVQPDMSVMPPPPDLSDMYEEDMSAPPDMSMPDQTPPQDFTPPQDLTDPHFVPVNTDLLFCVYTDNGATKRVNDFNKELGTERTSYFARVESWNKAPDAGMAPNGCVRLCNATNTYQLFNPPCKGVKCVQQNAPLGFILSLVWQVKLNPNIYIRDIKNDRGLKVGELTVTTPPIPGSDGGINYNVGILVGVPQFDAQQCSCYYFFNTLSCK